MQTVIGALAIVLVTTNVAYGQALTGQRSIVTVVAGDTLWSLGSRFGIDAL